MSSHLFFASTPFNMLTASMVAFSLPARDSKYICLIDQPPSASPFVKSFLTWKNSPFNSIQIVSKKSKGLTKKKQRKQELKKINQLISLINPSNIYTANDRRIEFQYAMAHCHCKAIGHYIDDGTYTYLGRKTHWIKDKLIDNFIKKISYGTWWKQPPTIGASDWISIAHVTFPKQVTPLLKGKNIKHLPLDITRSEFTELSQACLENYPELAHSLQQLDALLLLPHESVLDSTKINRLHTWITSKSGQCVAFKHHPRSTAKHSLQLEGLIELPAELPIEIMLSLFKTNCILCGDISTALLTAKCLRPDLEVEALTSATIPDGWKELLSGIGVSTK
ncbi:polysialyltransferase family glycosyltransferase [Amphritea sp. 1_MG-2023]|uniref:polysialyltransferase family glycosyltransferase n=1 Tax=Amphritea sp. 1_MG-2023 TaxID=3062670 RepID=UPI0026E43753|nr:polysialyltransferase family glycosyltransferase [Amphritea sp. 1_MG-2023]MDO6564788.1 polysialyltransferase family glycosyltransferase [Amphritea sp. 1_MG-2023]